MSGDRYYVIRIVMGPLPEHAEPSDKDHLFDDMAAEAARRVAPGLDAIVDTWIATDAPSMPAAYDDTPALLERISELTGLLLRAETAMGAYGPITGEGLPDAIRGVIAERDHYHRFSMMVGEIVRLLAKDIPSIEIETLLRDLPADLVAIRDERDRLRAVVAEYQRTYHALDHAVDDGDGVGPQYRDWKAAEAALLDLPTADAKEGT